MIRSLLKLLVLLVIGILIYNYFLGTPPEKKGVEKIVTELKDLGKSVGDLMKSEKEKFDKGKYDKALDKIGNTLKELKEKVKSSGDQYSEKIDELMRTKEQISEELQGLSEEVGETATDTADLKQKLRDLLDQTKQLITELEQNQ